MATIRDHQGRPARPLDAGWLCLSTAAGAVATPDALPEAGWMLASLPGTVAGARRAAGLWDDRAPPDLDAEDHWFRREGAALPGGARLECDGIGTLAKLWLDGRLLAESHSMFRPLAVTLPPGGGQRLVLCCRALGPRLRGRRTAPPARWRSRLADAENLREIRTSLLGHMPGWYPPVPVIGPYRPLRLVKDPAAGPLVQAARLRVSLAGRTGRVEVRLTGRDLPAAGASLHLLDRSAPFQPDGDALAATLEVADPPLWWPHTHGLPETCALAVTLADPHGEPGDARRVELGRIGFRQLEVPDPTGFGLRVNGAPVFCRGAIWPGVDPFDPAADPLPALLRARAGGMNMIRLPGTGLYATPELLAACDALGILVWQDFQFARFDYPGDPAFLAEARAEAEEFLAATDAHPSLAVLCGGSEVAQAAAMAGRPPADWSAPLYEEVLAGAAAAGRPDVPYVPNAPYGPDLPFAAQAPVAHYFGLGGYLRPAAELASAGVRFAAECLAFSNPPAPSLCRGLGVPGDAAWRRGIPRDAGTAWDFEDVRDHYVGTLFGVSPAALRRQDPEAWLAQGRAAMALLFEQALGTWRSDGVCAGAIALMLNDVLSGAGWGLLDAGLRPKSAWHGFRRAAQPVQIVLRDTGLNGVQLHGLNESATPRTVRLALRGLTPEGAVEPLGERFVILPARGALVVPATAMMGRWRDLGAVWGFGPAAFHALGATLHDAADGGLLSEATLFPGGPGQRFGPPAGLSVALREAAAGWQLDIGASGFAPFVTIDDDGCVAADEFFHLWPGETRVVALEPLGAARPRGVVGCLTGGAAYYEAAA